MVGNGLVSSIALARFHAHHILQVCRVRHLSRQDLLWRGVEKFFSQVNSFYKMRVMMTTWKYENDAEKTALF